MSDQKTEYVNYDVNFERNTKVLDGKTRKQLVEEIKDYKPMVSSEIERALSDLIAEKTKEVVIPRRLLINIYNRYMLQRAEIANQLITIEELHTEIASLKPNTYEYLMARTEEVEEIDNNGAYVHLKMGEIKQVEEEDE